TKRRADFARARGLRQGNAGGKSLKTCPENQGGLCQIQRVTVSFANVFVSFVTPASVTLANRRSSDFRFLGPAKRASLPSVPFVPLRSSFPIFDSQARA